MSDELQVSLLFGRDLKEADLLGKSDPYVLLQLEGSERVERSSTCRNTVNPEWGDGESFSLAFPEERDEFVLKLSVFDADLIGGDDALGVGELSVSRARFALSGWLFASISISEGGFVRVRLRLRVRGDKGRALAATVCAVSRRRPG